MRYYYNIEKDIDEYTVTFPDVPEAITCGSTEEEAISYVKECLITALEFYTEFNKPLPKQKTITNYFVDLIN